MSDFGLIATRFDATTASLRDFSEAIELIRRKAVLGDEVKLRAQFTELLKVLRPISVGFNGKLSDSMLIDEFNMTSILKQMHSRDWQSFKIHLTDLTKRLESGPADLSTVEMTILEDVADAIDAECAQLFKRISGRR